MAYKSFRESLAVGQFIDDIYVEVRNWQSIVAFIDAHERTSCPSNKEERIELLKKFELLANSYYLEYDRAVGSGTNFIENIDIFDMTERTAKLSPSQLKSFIEDLGGFPLANRLPRPPRFPQELSPYSNWHYTLDYNCLCRDIDYTEFRDGRLSAFIETTGKLNSFNHLKNSLQLIKQRLDLQIRILNILSKAFEVPSFIVIHLTDLSYFEVYDVSWNMVISGNQSDYASWLAQL